jgi:hypothetical protein
MRLMNYQQELDGLAGDAMRAMIAVSGTARIGGECIKCLARSGRFIGTAVRQWQGAIG